MALFLHVRNFILTDLWSLPKFISLFNIKEQKIKNGESEVFISTAFPTQVQGYIYILIPMNFLSYPSATAYPMQG